MTRAATIEDFQRVARQGVAFVPTAGRHRTRSIPPLRVGPPPPGFGPVVDKQGPVLGSPTVLIPPLPPSSPSPTQTDVRGPAGLGSAPSSPSSQLAPAPGHYPLNATDMKLVEIVRRAMVEALYDAPSLYVQSSPQEDPGAKGRSTSWVPDGGVVIVQGGSAGAIAAADALRLGVAHTVGASVLSIALPISVGSSGAPVTIFTFYAPDDRRLVARSIQCDISEPSGFVVLQFTVDVNGEQVLPFFNMKRDEWFDLNVSAQPGSTVTIKVACLKSTAAYVIRPKVQGWTVPVATRDDTLTSFTQPNNRRSPV